MPSTPDMPFRQDCLDKLLERLKVTLDLSTPPVSDEYAYQSLPLCVLDTIFSINAKYESTRNVIIRYCDHYGLQRVRQDPDILPPIEDQESLSGFIGKITSLGVEEFAKTILANRQRTSTRNGILKSEAVLRFAQVLQAHKVEYLQDVETIQGKEFFEKAIKEIPGAFRTGGAQRRCQPPAPHFDRGPAAVPVHRYPAAGGPFVVAAGGVTD